MTERLLSRLKRCEELLQAHGVKIEDDHAAGDGDSPVDVTAPASKTADGQIIVEHGHSRYIERYALRSFLGSSCSESALTSGVAICGKACVMRYISSTL